MDMGQFVRSHFLRAPGIAWFLGAGASAAAGIATADQMIWEFKRVIFATTHGVPAQSLNLGDPSVRERIQAHFDQSGSHPQRDADEEYAHYFETAWPHPQDRRAYLQRAIENGRPTYGHLCFGVLMALKKISVVWSTNFDRLIEDAAAQILGTTTALTVATLDSAAIASRAISEGRLPLFAKIHGDYQSERLKNTTTELQTQDRELLQALISAASTHGLAVVGFSGRDQSVMDALSASLDQMNPFPQGLFWFRRHGEQIRSQVGALLDLAKAKGVDAHLIEGGSFDELFGQVLLPFEVRDEYKKQLDMYRKRQWKSPFALPGRGQGWPILRLNALRVTEFPRVCRRIECGIGGTKEVREAVDSATAAVVAIRRRDGVIAFGSDAEVRRAFDSFTITSFDVAPIDITRLARSSSDLGLLYDALVRAVARGAGLRSGRVRREHTLVVESSTPRSAGLEALRKQVGGSVFGVVPGTNLNWAEGVRLRLEWHFDDLWLIAEPYVWVEYPEDSTARETRLDFIRRRTDKRYNPIADGLFESWSMILSAGPFALVGLREGEGIDAIFKMEPKNAFARELRAQR